MNMNLSTASNRSNAVMQVRIALNAQRALVATIAKKCKQDGKGQQRLVEAGQKLDDLVRDLNAIGEKDV